MSDKILLVQTAFLGDIILTTPLIKALSEIYASGKLTILTTPTGYRVLEELDEIDDFIVYDKKDIHSGPWNFYRLIRKIRSLDFDRGFAAHKSARTSLLMYFSGIPETIGFSAASFPFVYTTAVDYPENEHSVDRYLNLLTGIGENPDAFGRDPLLSVKTHKEEKLQKSLAVSEIGVNDPFAVISPASVWGTKMWVPEYFAELIDRLAYDYGIKTVLTGTRDEKEIGYKVENSCFCPVVNLVGKTSIAKLIALINLSTFVITNDSGPMHIAAALKKPQVAIYGSTTPSLGYAPFHSKSRIAQIDLDCRPCSNHGPEECPKGHHRCMYDLDVDQVYSKAKDLLEDMDLKSSRSD